MSQRCVFSSDDQTQFGTTLTASMGLIGKTTDPAVQEAIGAGIELVCRGGKAAGVLTADRAIARKYLDLGALFVAAGLDVSLLVRAAQDLALAFKRPA